MIQPTFMFCPELDTGLKHTAVADDDLTGHV